METHKPKRIMSPNGEETSQFKSIHKFQCRGKGNVLEKYKEYVPILVIFPCIHIKSSESKKLSLQERDATGIEEWSTTHGKHTAGIGNIRVNWRP